MANKDVGSGWKPSFGSRSGGASSQNIPSTSGSSQQQGKHHQHYQQQQQSQPSFANLLPPQTPGSVKAHSKSSSSRSKLSKYHKQHHEELIPSNSAMQQQHQQSHETGHIPHYTKTHQHGHGQPQPHHQQFSGSSVGGGGGGTSGMGIMGTSGELDNLDSSSRNPLHCFICNNVFDDPRLLSCYHSFCAKCLDGRLGDTKLSCPLCGKVTSLKEGSGPSTDHLLRYLLHNTSDTPQPSCANCDNKSRLAMFYCNTCGQVLCNGCREETHRAKMFSAHDVIPVSRHQENVKKCSIHGEHYIMFSTAQKTMLCINCYRDTAMDARLHCIDLDTAYSQGCRKLERAVISLRDLQAAVRDGITMLKTVLEELRRNSDSEKSALNAVCQTILDALTKTQENLLRDVDCQLEGKDKVIRGQLAQLRAVLPTIKLHLTMCATISNTSSKYDFLDLAYPLIDRLTAITHMGYPTRPGQSSQIKSSYKSEIARTLEPWVSGIGVGPVTPGHVPLSSSTTNVPSLSLQQPHGKDYMHPSMNLTSVDPANFAEPTYSQYYPMSRSTVTPQHPRPKTPVLQQQSSSSAYVVPQTQPQQSSSHTIPPSSSGRKTPTSKLKLTVDSLEEQFTAHCRSFSSTFNELNSRLIRLKEQVQDLHRDVTLQKGASYTIRTEAALREGILLEEQLNRKQAEMERVKKLFESTWNEHMRQVRIEQEVFQTQMNDLMSLRAEVKQLSSILQQLQSFLKTVGVHQIQTQGNSGGPPPPSAGSGSSGGMMGQGGSGSLGRQQQQQQQQHHQQTQIDSKSFHPTGSTTDGILRAESGSQVTPSLSEMAFSSKAQSVMRPGIKNGSMTGSGTTQKPSDIVSRLGRFSISNVSSQGGTGMTQSSGLGTKRVVSNETDYIQVDASYLGVGIPPPPPPPQHSKRGLINQLMDKVRSKEDRKKSTSSSGSGPVVNPLTANAMSIASATSIVAANNRAAARAAMYDAQVQYTNVGNFKDKSAVTALRRSGSQRRGGGRGGSVNGANRPPYIRENKSKSDDERPPAKLSRETRARSIAAIDPESLLRSLQRNNPKEASRVLSIYQSLLASKEKSAFYKGYPPSSQQAQQTHHHHQAHSEPSGSSGSRTGRYSSNSRKDEGNYMSEDDYQQISFGRLDAPLPPPRLPPLPHHHHTSQSFRIPEPAAFNTVLRKPIPVLNQPAIPSQYSSTPRHGHGHSNSLGRNSTRKTSRLDDFETLTPSRTQVKVYVHEEPRSVRSSPGTLSKSLDEKYLFGYVSHKEPHTSSSSSDRPSMKKPISCESLISLSSDTGNGGNSRKSSIDFDRRSVVTVRQAGSKSALIVRQHSWEAGSSSISPGGVSSLKPPSSSSTPLLSPDLGPDDDEFGRSSSSSCRRGQFEESGNGLHKADSFEGHENAVRSIVAAVQDVNRTMKRKLQSN